MARNAQSAQTVASPSGQPGPQETALLGQIKALLDEGQAQKAIDLLVAARSNSPWLTNALGVCLLRVGNAGRAVEMFRASALAKGSTRLQQEAPTVFKTNFATALLLTDHPVGGVAILHELQEEQHPAVQRLRAAMERWRQGLSVWQKLQWYTGGHPSKPVTLDFPPGDL